ncbi:replication protein A 70 kDa DNA-binding subunit B isoform X2 [Capsicum chacoense]
MCTFSWHKESEIIIMDQKLLVDAITTETADWTCKVQVVDKFRPHKSSDSFIHFQTIIMSDEKEQQVSIVLYDDDIPKYEKLFALFETYLVSCTKFRDPRGYSIRADTYEWVVDRYIIVEVIKTNDVLEALFPTPTKLNALSFSDIEYQHPGVEFDLLAVVANSNAIQYTAIQLIKVSISRKRSSWIRVINFFYSLYEAIWLTTKGPHYYVTCMSIPSF